MATYLELRTLFNDATLLNRIDAAIVIAAQVILANAATETAERVAWAQRGIRATRSESERALRYALAANKDLTVADILGAADAALQSAVDAAVNGLALGLTPGD